MTAYKQKPILEAFKSAGRLANEWRDTLFYTGLLGVGIGNAVCGWGLSSGHFVGAIQGRELIRLFGWGFDNKDPRHFFYADAPFFVASAIPFATLITPPPVPVVLALGGIGSYISFKSRRVKGLSIKGCFKFYEELLFDYPRKKLPPQDREGHKIKVKFQDFWAGIKEKLKNIAPAPTTGPALIPVRIERNGVKEQKNHIPA